MLLNLTKAYPELVKECTVVRFREEHRAYEFVAEVLLLDDTRLFIRDYLFFDGDRKYSYHWQKQDGTLISRWDNAPHWPDIRTYPHHTHGAGGAVPIESDVRSIADVMDEIKKNYHGR
jgi:hypothetical protein